jgi:hypothetical protein
MVDIRKRKQYTKPFLLVVVLLVLFLMIGSLVGQNVSKEKIYNSMIKKIDSCEDNNQIPKAYQENDKEVNIMCIDIENIGIQ